MTGPGLLAGGLLPVDIDRVTPSATYRVPGVHVEFATAGRAISPRRTDIAGFVGICSRGPLFTPVRTETWGEFVSAFGRHVRSGYLAHSVEAFFANGGRTAWVVRVAHPASGFAAQLPLVDDVGAPALLLIATWTGPGTPVALPNPGRWAHRMTVSVDRDRDRFDLTVRGPDGIAERWQDLGIIGPRRVADVVNDPATGSRLVSVEVAAEAGGTLPTPSEPRAFSGGTDGLTDLTIRDVVGGIAALEGIDEIAILAAPDLQSVPREEVVFHPPSPRCDLPGVGWEIPVPEPDPGEYPPQLDVLTGQTELIAQCERTRDRFAILDPPRAATNPEEAIGWRNGLTESTYAAAYFPWLLMPDPLSSALVRAVPPGGHVAGVFARLDREVGVHRAPANAALELAADVLFRADDRDHGDANAAGLNVIRAYEGRGIRLAGARTLANRAPWRFINVRRLVAMVQEAIEADLAWVVFEPNNADLWADVDRTVRGFLDNLWRAGMLDGATANEAFDVRCDAETNPPDQVDLGQLSCLIALRPPPPAEFVVVRVTLTPDGVDAETVVRRG